MKEPENCSWNELLRRVGQLEAAEQARVYRPFRCVSCKRDLFENEQCHCVPPKPAPVVEKFVMWDDVIAPNTQTIRDNLWQQCYTRRKRGDVVAESPNERRADWLVTLPDGTQDLMNWLTYQRLKRNGCFGEQVKT